MWKVASPKTSRFQLNLLNSLENNSNKLNIIRLLSNWNTKVSYFILKVCILLYYVMINISIIKGSCKIIRSS